MTTPKTSPHPEITAALGRIPWLTDTVYVACDKDGEWGAFSEYPRPKYGNWETEKFWLNGKLEEGAWPGDWRDSLHRVTRKDGVSAVEWVGSR